MINRVLPYYLEARTGHYTGTDFDEIYDRLFLRVARPTPAQAAHYPSPDTTTTLMIYDTGRRSASPRLSRPPPRAPAVVLEFGAHGALGTVSFRESGVSMPMGHYLRKTSMFAG